MASILNTIAAITASRQFSIDGTGLRQTIEHLSTPKLADQDSDKALVQIRTASQGRRNAADGMSYLQVAYTVLSEVRNLLTRAAELSNQARMDFTSDSNRVTLNAEFQSIIKTVADIGLNTKFNGTNVFGAELDVAVGSFGTVRVSVGSISSSASSALGLTLGAITLISCASAESAAAAVIAALKSVGETRASLSASVQRLVTVSNALGIQAENLTARSNHLREASPLDEVVNLIKWQILSLSGTSALNQVNQVNQSHQQILALLQESDHQE